MRRIVTLFPGETESADYSRGRGYELSGAAVYKFGIVSNLRGNAAFLIAFDGSHSNRVGNAYFADRYPTACASISKHKLVGINNLRRTILDVDWKPWLQHVRAGARKGNTVLFPTDTDSLLPTA